MQSSNFLGLGLVLAITAACKGGGDSKERLMVEGDAQENSEVTPLELDPECTLGDHDYVVRGVWPRTQGDESPNFLVRGEDIRDVDVLEYEVHACREIVVTGGSFWLYASNGFRGEEELGDPRDSSGMIIGELANQWVTRFYGFTLTVDGRNSYSREVEEYTLSDSSGGPQWHDLNYRMKAGEILNFTLSTSVRELYMPAYDKFALDYSPIVADVAGEPASGLELTDVQSIRLIH